MLFLLQLYLLQQVSPANLGSGRYQCSNVSPGIRLIVPAFLEEQSQARDKAPGCFLESRVLSAEETLFEIIISTLALR